LRYETGPCDQIMEAFRLFSREVNPFPLRVEQFEAAVAKSPFAVSFPWTQWRTLLKRGPLPLKRKIFFSLAGDGLSNRQFVAPFLLRSAYHPSPPFFSLSWAPLHHIAPSPTSFLFSLLSSQCQAAPSPPPTHFVGVFALLQCPFVISGHTFPLPFSCVDGVFFFSFFFRFLYVSDRMSAATFFFFSAEHHGFFLLP